MTTIFGEGPINPKLFIIGEAPGHTEDETGRPFISAAGQSLNEMLAYLEVDRADCYITNLVKCRPPLNRQPLNDELDACYSLYLKWQMTYSTSNIVILLGSLAVSRFLQNTLPLSEIIGHSYKLDNSDKIAIPLLHPASLLYNPDNRRLQWEAMDKIKPLLS